MGRGINRLSTSITNAGFAVDLKFVAFGMTADIIMIVEDENFCFWTFFAIKISGG